MIFWEFGESNPLEGFILPGALEQPRGRKSDCGGFWENWVGQRSGWSTRKHRDPCIPRPYFLTHPRCAHISVGATTYCPVPP